MQFYNLSENIKPGGPHWGLYNVRIRLEDTGSLGTIDLTTEAQSVALQEK